MPDTNSRYWVFTRPRNEYSCAWFRAMLGALPHHKYSVFQLESGASTGYEHFQGYVEFTKSIKFSAVRAALGEAVHVAMRLGTRDQARDYCMKDDTRLEGPFENGTFGSGQGERSDLAEFAAAIEATGYSASALAFPTQFLKYGRNAKELAAIGLRRAACALRDVQVVFLWGPSGVGKTRAAMSSFAEGDDVWWSPSSTPGAHTWYAYGYEGQHSVILDDLRDSVFPLTFLLRLLDRYPLQVNTSGSAMSWCARRIIITSNVDPAEWYLGVDPMSRAAFVRRISPPHGRVIHMTQPEQALLPMWDLPSTLMALPPPTPPSPAPPSPPVPPISRAPGYARSTSVDIGLLMTAMQSEPPSSPPLPSQESPTPPEPSFLGTVVEE